MGKKNGVEKDTSPSLNDDESDYPDPTANERMRKYLSQTGSMALDNAILVNHN
ncbi:hypothetical protein HOLleu_16923 [Holothuria leucospilota]|uniref:Uncharacterized protein n=1 Tax=Holothuria leucospilota TaxID=206669 RepID=A0A9Q1C5X8_HOLLE|nr:hypothetical protein HOLleu_16923 [Holothuria leucospilota]